MATSKPSSSAGGTSAPRYRRHAREEEGMPLLMVTRPLPDGRWHRILVAARAAQGPTPPRCGHKLAIAPRATPARQVVRARHRRHVRPIYRDGSLEDQTG